MGQGDSTQHGEEYNYDEQLYNPLDEVQILEGHKDIVRLCLSFNHTIVATASDDTVVKLWDWRRCRLVHSLCAHTRPVTCLLKVSSRRIASASSDKQVIIWDVASGTPVARITAHCGPIQCMVRVRANVFCSGGADDQLLLWDSNAVLLGTIKRHEDENMHCMLSMGSRVITGSSSSALFVYDVERMEFVTVLATHRESVRCLAAVDSQNFVSGALDGSIVLWDSKALKPIRILYFPERFRDESHVYTSHVRSLACLTSGRYVVAAVGDGFIVFDVAAPVGSQKVLQNLKAHDAPVLQVLPLYKGTKIVTCSEDAMIKLWGPGTLDLTAGAPQQTQGTIKKLFSKSSKTVAPVCLGEMAMHSSSVNAIAALSPTSLISVSSDHTITIWKDGKAEAGLRNNFAIASLLAHQMGTPVPQLSVTKKKESLEKIVHRKTQKNSSINSLDSSESLPAADPPTVHSVEPAEPVDVPDYLVASANLLIAEKGFSVDQVCTQFEQEGHSKAIIQEIRKLL